MNYFERIKNEICEKIYGMNEEEIYELLQLLENNIHIESAMHCKKCEMIYGLCSVGCTETECRKRYMDYFKTESE